MIRALLVITVTLWGGWTSTGGGLTECTLTGWPSIGFAAEASSTPKPQRESEAQAAPKHQRELAAQGPPFLSSDDLKQRARKGCRALLGHRFQQIKNWLSYSVPGHKGRTRLKYVRTRRQLLKKPDQEAFVQQLWDSHDNTQKASEGHLAALKGFSWRRSVLNDRRASNNGNVFVPTYFKQHDVKQKKVWLAVQHLWSRPLQPNKAQQAEITKSVATVREWLDVFLNYRTSVNEAIRVGFQARLQAQALAEYRKQLYVEDFAQRRALELELPFLQLDPNTHATQLEWRKVLFRNRMQIYGLQKRYHEDYRNKFGLPEPPLRALKDDAMYYAEGMLASALSPVRLSVQALKFFPLLFRSSLRFVHNMGLGLWAYVHEGGEIYKHLRAQAFYYQRLQIVLQLLQARVDMHGVQLMAQEQSLLQDIQKALQDPLLAPRSDAVRHLQNQIYKSETLLFFSDKLLTGRAVAFDALDDFSYLQEEKKIPILRQTLRWAKQHKVVAFLGASMALSLTAGFEQVVQRASFLIRDNPRVGYHISSFKHNFHVFLDETFGKNLTSRLELSKSDARSNFGFERYTLANVVDEFFAYVREQRRINPDYNYLTDPEYNEKLDRALENMLSLREEYSGAAQLAHAKGRLLSVVLPRKILSTMHQAYLKHWPAQKIPLQKVFDDFLQAYADQNVAASSFVQQSSAPQNPMQTTPMQQNPVQQNPIQQIVDNHQHNLPPELYEDLTYFATEGYKRAFAHYYDQQFGALMSSQGGAYEVFGKKP